MNEILIPKNLSKGEYVFTKKFLGKFIDAEIRQRKGQPMITAFRQPIDFKKERLMKLDRSSDGGFIFFLVDSYLSSSDLASVVFLGQRMTTKDFKITFDGTRKLKLEVPNPDRIYVATQASTLYKIVQDCFCEKNMNIGFQLNAISGQFEVDTTKGEWISAPEYVDKNNNWLISLINK